MELLKIFKNCLSGCLSLIIVGIIIMALLYVIITGNEIKLPE